MDGEHVRDMRGFQGDERGGRVREMSRGDVREMGGGHVREMRRTCLGYG